MTPPNDPESRVRESFNRQAIMSTLGAELSHASKGKVEITLPHRPELGQQHGFLHAGALATILDSACGYAALTLMPAEAAVLSVDFTVHLLAPAAGERSVARAEVVRAGRTLTVCRAEAFTIVGTEEKRVAIMTATMMSVIGRTGLHG